MSVPLLSLLIIVPLLGAALCAFLPRGAAVRWVGLLAAALELVLAAGVWLQFDPNGGMSFVERARWVPTFGLEYHLGVDGLSVPLVALNALLLLVSLAGSRERAGERGYTGLLLFSSAAVAGAFMAQDLALFFVFWEAMLLPVVLLVGMYGRDETRRARAALQFFLYTTAGSLLMLLSIVALPFFAWHPGAPLDLGALAGARIDNTAQLWLLLGFVAAFAVKTPLFPLHTWLPSLYESAPVPALAYTTMLVKVGAYGFLRVIPIFPHAAATIAPVMVVLSILGILYGGALAATAPTFVLTLAYSSIAHLGFVSLGIWSLTTQGAQGAVVQMVNHGVTVGALFLLALYLLRRTGTLEYARLGGLARTWPVMYWLVLLATLASLGLPGLNGFVGEFLLLLGAFRSHAVYVVAVLGVVLAAVYSLRYVRLIFYGPEHEPVSSQPDLRPRELWPVLPLLLLIVVIGLYPRPLLMTSESFARQVVARPASVAQLDHTGGER